MRDLFASRDPEFGGVLSTLQVGDRLAAAQFHLRGTRTLHAVMIAQDAAFERYAPGLLLFQSVLKWMAASPVQPASTSASRTSVSSVSWPTGAKA